MTLRSRPRMSAPTRFQPYSPAAPVTRASLVDTTASCVRCSSARLSSSSGIWSTDRTNAPPLLTTALCSRSLRTNSLDVPHGHVWTSQAKDDYVANLGRGSVENGWAPGHGDQPSTSGANPTRSTLINVPSEHPLNPADADWGARTFSSNDERIDGLEYAGSDGHEATPATEAALSHKKESEDGYLDPGTSSLRNTAYTSLGYTPSGKQIP